MTLPTLRQGMLQSSNTSMATSPLLLSMLMAVWRSEHEQRLPMPGGSVDSTLTNKNQIYEAAVNLLLEQSLTKHVGWERVGTPNVLKRECWGFLQQLAALDPKEREAQLQHIQVGLAPILSAEIRALCDMQAV